MWLGWSDWLQIKSPVETHIHANNWGFISLAFAGMILDMYPIWPRRPLAWPRSITPIFWLLTIGVLALVIGPWIASNWFSAPGIILFLAGTIWLLLNVIKPLRGITAVWSQPSYAYVPYFYYRMFLPQEPARLGGNWFSLVTMNLGGLFLCVGIFLVDKQGFLHGTAYLLWTLSLVPLVLNLWQIMHRGLATLESGGSLAESAAPGD